jgi:Orsellinic acid/F9775 biosynthesis cluster protein D
MMEPFNRIFQHLREFRIIQCKTCAYAVVPDQMNGHLRDHHKEISASTRQQIVDVVKGMDGVARQQEDVVYPPATATAIQGFPLGAIVTRLHLESGAKPHTTLNFSRSIWFSVVSRSAAALIGRRPPLKVSAWQPLTSLIPSSRDVQRIVGDAVTS